MIQSKYSVLEVQLLNLQQQKVVLLHQSKVSTAIATVKSNDPVKVFSVRGTAFEPTAAEGSSASSEQGI